MKKTLIILILLMVIIGTVSAGTLAVYTVSLDNLANGSVVAKEFVFVGDGTDTFQQGVKIAPSETVNWRFKIKNYQGNIITETDLYYKLTFQIAAAAGKTAIQPLTVTVKDLSGNVLNRVTGVGTFDVLGAFPVQQNGQEKEFLVEIYWPDGGSNDINYAGNNYGTSINVDAAASQVPFSGTNPGQENPPQQEQFVVKYETTIPWENGQSGNYQYAYRVTITNNSSQPIEDWNLAFDLHSDKLLNVWSNAILASYLPSGSYVFVNPAYNNPATDDILPGQSVSFDGKAKGNGNIAIQNLRIGGSNIATINNPQLICEFGKPSFN